MKTNYRLLALLLAILTMLSLVSCKENEEQVTEPSESVQVFADGEFMPSNEYSLVCSAVYRNSIKMVDSLNYLKEALDAVYGIKTYITPDNANTKRDYEIIIGDTSREASELFAAETTVGRFAYSIESEKCIVIRGGSLDDTAEAIKHFCSEVLGYNGEAGKTYEKKVLKVGTSFVSDPIEYPLKSYSIDGVAIDEFLIAVNRALEINYAESMVEGFGAYTGKAPKIVDYDSLNGDEKAVICLGAFDRTQTTGIPVGLEGYCIRFDSTNGKISIGIDANSEKAYIDAAKVLVEALAPADNATEANVDLPKNSLADYKYKTSSQYTPEWILESDTEEELSEGVVYKELLYKDPNGKPYRAYVLIIDPKYNSIYMGSSADGYEYAPEKKQTVAQHMSAAAENGVKVIAGVNADFFDISGDYHPGGIAIKEGTLISAGGYGAPYLAFSKDGKAMIGQNGLDANVNELRTAVGGSHVLVKDGFPLKFDMTDEFIYAGHPRTLAGVTEDGRIILAVVDGRQPDFSNGASAERCALLMISLGAKDAMNLDGGGSSAMVINRDGKMTAENRGSDGALRRVYNSVIVVKN
jgi:exopolysaccharide biosynthesis protein